MAHEVLVSPLVGLVFENLVSLIQKNVGLVLGVNKQLEKLSNILSTIRDVLEDAEVKQIDDKSINTWLRDLKDLTYDADDILDLCGSEHQVHNPLLNKSSHSIGKKIKTLLEKFDVIVEMRTKFHLNLTPKLVESGRKEQRKTSSTLYEPQVYGREKEKEHIANLLLKGEGEDVSVCCILGMGGLGKTTVAQMVYNNHNIAKHFELRCWVCVSNTFVLPTLLKSIIESTTGEPFLVEDLDPLERRVQRILSGKRFLLVLDDVWNEDQTNWYKLKSLLTCGGRGSSIIITTRLQSVASLTSTLPIQCLEFLSAENCWFLFKHYAFDVENKEYHQNLEEAGKEIVKKCGGVPLAVKALGGLLRFKKSENEWLSVRDSALWDLPQDKERDILPALRLSFNHLPSHLKGCFSFCSMYSKGSEMLKQDLIELWNANGFCQSKESMEEDTANEIFNELLWRSFFQVAMKDEDGDIVSCKMHDLVHDLACSITTNECRSVVVHRDNNVLNPPTRHLLLEFGLWSSPSNILNSWLSKSQPLLRTFFQSSVERQSIHFIHGLNFKNLKCLRVLNLSNTNITTLDVSIGDLKHLRYLNLSYCGDLRSLPDEHICNLRKLQVLKLNYCQNLQRLPENMKKMTNLIHLGIKGCDALRRMPVGMGNLSCLRTLSMFIVAPESGHGITELQGLDHLRGELKIQGLEHVRNSKDAKNANLIRKKHLRVLSLFWSKKNNETIEEEEEVASIGEGLQPHTNIKVLHLKCYNGLNFPSWMSHSCLPNLVEISLVGCRRCEHLLPFGQLPFLKVLQIDGMESVKCIGDEFYGDHHLQGSSLFPSLQQFSICNMSNLEEWYAPSSKEEEENITVFSSLRCLTLEGCPKLRTLPTTLLSALRELNLGGECNEMMLESSSLVKVLGCLQRLVIKSFNKIETLPKVLLENLPSTLTILRIEHCKELVCLPAGVMQNLTSLNSFDILECPSLKQVPELRNINNMAPIWWLSIKSCGLTSVSDCLRHLTTLQVLWIHGCPELEFLPDDFQDLTSLRYLEIGELPQMRCLPQGLQKVAETLEWLDIYGCWEIGKFEGLASLPEWMDKFTSLRKLGIYDCKNLKVLPEEVLQLTSLESVTIRDCHPDLHKRYTKETGEDWHKIAHIPILSIIVSPRWKKRHDTGIASFFNVLC